MSNKNKVDYSSLYREFGYWEAEQIAYPKASLRKIKTITYAVFLSVIVLPWAYALFVYLPNDPQADKLIAAGSLAAWYTFIAIVIIFTRNVNRDAARLAYFADDNGYTYSQTLPVMNLGIFANVGGHPMYHDAISGSHNNKYFRICNLLYVTGSGKTQQEHTVGVIELSLPTDLPNIFLDSTENNLVDGFGLSRYISGSQKLSLEGDFDNYFTLFTPKNYERDALYFITPELMQLLIEKGKDLDFEVLENTLKFYKKDGFTFTKEDFEYMFSLLDTIGGEFIENTQHYSDEKSKTKAEVALVGRSLRPKQMPAPLSFILSFLPIALVIIYLYFAKQN